MVTRKAMVCVAASAALAMTCLARADDASIASRMPASNQAALPTLSLSQPAYLDDTTAPATAPAATPTLLMSALDRVGVGKVLEDLHVAIYGHVEGSYEYANHHPPGDFITGRAFDVDYEQGEMNQADVIVERTVNDAMKNHQFDVGARFELLWGTDARFIHSLGDWDTQHSMYQWDVTQAYFDIAIPVGNGLRIRGGKFVTMAGQEVIDPTGNLLYSHSFLFTYAIPFTQTGAYATYALTDKLTIDAGMTRGWDTSLRDNNGTWDFIGRATYAFTDKTSGIVDVIVGPDQPGDNSHYRDLVDAILTTSVGDNLALALNADYGWEAHSAALGGRTSAQWFGAAGYFSIGLDRSLDKTPMFALNGRVEYFNDDKGVRVPGAGGGVEMGEATLGVAITPFPDNAVLSNLVFRPEVRYDLANKRFFNAGSERQQVTAAVDAIFKF